MKVLSIIACLILTWVSATCRAQDTTSTPSPEKTGLSVKEIVGAVIGSLVGTGIISGLLCKACNVSFCSGGKQKETHGTKTNDKTEQENNDSSLVPSNSSNPIIHAESLQLHVYGGNITVTEICEGDCSKHGNQPKIISTLFEKFTGTFKANSGSGRSITAAQHCGMP